MSTELAVTNDEKFISTQLERFVVTKEDLLTLVDQFKDLKIEGIEDKKGLAAVHEARMTLKKKRVDITNLGKGLREAATAFNKAVMARQDELVAVISPREEELESQEIAIAEEKERLKKQKEEEAFKRVQERISKLKAVGAEHDFQELRDMPNQQFIDILEDHAAAWDKAQEQIRADKAEEKRVAEVEKRRLSDEKAEQDKERIRLEGVAAEQKRQQDLLNAEKEKLEKEKQSIIDAKERRREEMAQAIGMVESVYGYEFPVSGVSFQWSQALTDQEWGNEFKRIQGEHLKFLEEKSEREEQERIAKEAAEKKRQEDAVAKALKDKEEKDEKDRLAKIEADRVAAEQEAERIAQLPDGEIFAMLYNKIIDVGTPEHWALKSKKGKAAAVAVYAALEKACLVCKQNF